MAVWFRAMRPWSFTASFIPITLGFSLAYLQGKFDIFLYLVTLFGGICLHAGTNLINSYGDYIAGVDTLEAGNVCPEIASGKLLPVAVRNFGLLAFSIGAGIGILLAYYRGWPIIAAALIGIIFGYSYTAGSCPYKYAGLGVPVVFFLMGPMMVWPAYYIQTQEYSWLPILVSLPVSFLVAGILHANDIRDVVFDQKAGIRTLALSIGLKNSLFLYFSLYIGALVSLSSLLIFQFLPWTAALPWLLLPVILRMLYSAYQAVHGAEHLLLALEGNSAKLHFQFGLLFLLGIFVYPYMIRWL